MSDRVNIESSADVERNTEVEWDAWMTESWDDWMPCFSVCLFRLIGVRVWQVPGDINLRQMWQTGMDAEAAALKAAWFMGYDVFIGDGAAFQNVRSEV